MSKGNTFENDLMKLIFQATGIANIADNASGSPLTNLYVSLHTADVGEAGDQTTNETGYTGYGRVAVARSTLGWSVSNNQAQNVATVSYTVCGTTGSTVTHFAVGTAATSTGKVLYKGTLTSQLAISSGVTPQFAPNQITVTED